MKEIVKRINHYLLFSVLLVAVLHFAKIILVPIALGALLAMLMAPVCRRLDDRGFHRALSCIICTLILVAAFAGIAMLVIAEVNSFSQDLSLVETKAKEVFRQIQSFIQEKFNIEPEKQISIAKEQAETVQKSGGNILGNLLNMITTTAGTMVLMLVYMFLFLYNKEKFETFFVRLYNEEDPEKVKNIVTQISYVSQQYLTGRAISILVIATEYSIALLIIGIKNAILLALIAALLTIIPYIGTVIGGLIPFLMALATEPSYEPALWVAFSIFMIQTIDNYFQEPNIVGGEVRLNAFASIISIIAGGVVWGVAGMILFLPLVSIVKIIADHVESLKPISYLIGNGAEQKTSRIREWFKAKFSRKKED